MTNKRQSHRLKHYDYAHRGYYFVTICTNNMIPLFGDVIEGKMVLNEAGMVVREMWSNLPYYYGVDIDVYQIMPNHFHGIIILNGYVGAGLSACPKDVNIDGQPQRVAPTMSLSDVVHRFKSLTTNKYIKNVHLLGWPRFNKRLWQRNYYDHIIRNENSLHQIREYIINNPLKWELDGYYR